MVAGDGAELAELLEQDRSEGGDERVWQALARVEDDEPTFVLQDGPANGVSVTCRVLSGPFEGQVVAAMMGCPLGALQLAPMRKGQRVLLAFLDGTLSGGAVAVASVPGGKENPVPSAIAGIPLTSEGLADQGSAAANRADQPRGCLYAPDKGVGDREYYRGAIKVIRLKGAQDDFFSGFVVAADDGASIEMRWNSMDQDYVTEIKDKDGMRLAVGGGFATLSDADGTAMVQVSKGKVFIQADQVVVNGSTCVQIDGGAILIGMGLVPPTPINACAVGVAGPVNVCSTKVFIGVA